MKTIKRDWWVIVLVGCFVVVAISDPIVWVWMGRYWAIVAAVTLCLGLILGGLWGFKHGQTEYGRGFRAGEKWRKT